MGLSLIKAHICVAIAVLDIDNHVTDDIYARSVAEELLVCRFCIILLCFKELMVEINIVGFHLIQFTSGNQGFYKHGTPMHISITEIAYASGMLIGGLLLGLFGNYQKRILLITASIFMMGISLTISGLLPQSGFFIFVVCCAIMGLSVPFYSGVQTALFQEKIKPEYLGRVFSLTGSIMSLAMPIGLILSGFFADRIGVNHWFLLSGVLIIGIAIACPMITEVRKLDLKQNS